LDWEIQVKRKLLGSRGKILRYSEKLPITQSQTAFSEHNSFHTFARTHQHFSMLRISFSSLQCETVSLLPDRQGLLIKVINTARTKTMGDTLLPEQ